MILSSKPNRSRKLMWRLSYFSSVTFLMIIILTWLHVDHHYNANTEQLTSIAAAKADLTDKLKKSGINAEQPFTYIPTGVFIQSLDFSSSNNVKITGYIWQTLPTAANENQPVEPSFIFPEQVDGGKVTLAYQQVIEKNTVYGWHFNVVLRQQFSYLDYPLDHKTVWIRITPAYFDRNILLTPALDNYESTEEGRTFGVEQGVVLGNWEIDETFFDYKTVSYDTNFGIHLQSHQYEYPELYFNVVMKRKFLNSFIINLVPLLTVAALLFALLMTVTADLKKREAVGFNFTGVISIVSALFFVVLIAHIQLREQFSEDGIVYIEYFFLLMYFVMIMLIINTYFFSRGKAVSSTFIMADDNLMPKLCFWPFILGVLALVTLFKFVFN
mgnify:CR=1 FL=1